MNSLDKKKDKVLANWQPGDDAAAARWFEKMTGVPVTSEALLQWRRGGGSRFTALYIEAHRRVQKDRARASKQVTPRITQRQQAA